MDIKKVCPECGSDDISRDASARWSIEKQEWELCVVYDKYVSCGDCGYEGCEYRFKDEEV